MKKQLWFICIIALPVLIYGQGPKQEDVPFLNGISGINQERAVALFQKLPFMCNTTDPSRLLLPETFAKKTTPFEPLQWDSLNVRYKGSWPFCTPFDVEGDSLRNLMFLYFYAGGVWVIDVSNPSNPVKINEDIRVRGDPALHPLFYTPWDSLLYIAGGPMGLEIWDTKSISAPSCLGQFTTPGQATSICVKGDYAYLGNEYTLRVLDVSDPSNPFEIGSLPGLPGYLWDLTASGNYVYTAEENGVSIIDISNPSSPNLAGRFDNVSFGKSLGIAVKDNYAYVGIDSSFFPSTGYLLVLDVSNPSDPQLAGSLYFNGDGQIYSVDIQGDYAYLTTSWSWAPVVDISDPFNPVRVADITGSSWNYNIKASGNLAFISAHMSYWVADISDPTNPITLALVEPPDIATNITDVGISGQYAYVTSFNSGLRIHDITIPHHPVEVGYTGLSGMGLLSPAFAVAMDEQNAYVAMICGGLRIVNIADPANPIEVGSYTGSHSLIIWNVRVRDTLAFLAKGEWTEPGGLVILNIANPTAPQEVSYFSIGSGDAWDVEISGNYAFLVSAEGLHSIDISNPAIPIEVDFIPSPYSPDRGIQISGNYAYIAGGDYSNIFFQIVDISNPDSLIEKSTLWLDGHGISAYGVAVEDTMAYVVAGPISRLVVISVANPDSAYVIGYIDVPDDEPHGVAAKNGLAYVAAWNGGVQIYEAFSPSGISEMEFSYGKSTGTLNLLNNPVRGGEVRVTYTLSQHQHISLELYNLAGQLIKVCASGYRDKGHYNVNLPVKNLPAGVYFVVLKTQQESLSKKIVVLK